MDILSGRVYMYMVSVCSPFRQQHAIMNHFKSLLHKAWRLNDLVESNQHVSPRFFQGEAVSRLNFPCPPPFSQNPGFSAVFLRRSCTAGSQPRRSQGHALTVTIITCPFYLNSVKSLVLPPLDIVNLRWLE
jgi:hypothetical protein